MLKIFLDKHQHIASEKTTGQKLLYMLILFAAMFLLSFLIICITPIKRLIPGYPTEKVKKEMVQNQITLDSLKQQIEKWQKELQDIQMITSGHTPIQETTENNTQADGTN